LNNHVVRTLVLFDILHNVFADVTLTKNWIFICLFALKAEVKPETEEAASLPPCETGCTESKLGLRNIEPEGDIWELLRVNSSSRRDQVKIPMSFPL